MAYRLSITGPAKRDVLENVEWWSENRSAEQADRWLAGINRAMQTLKEAPEQHGLADEKALQQASVRQLAYGLGHRPTHRILYAITTEGVIVYRVRSVRQNRLRVSDLAE